MAEHLLTGGRVLSMADDAPDGGEIADILIRDGAIAAVGRAAAAMAGPDADRHDLSGCVVTPGLVNTHHHLYQTLTRAVPAAQDATLFDWLRTLYPIWARYTPDHVALATRLGLAELALSGCTTSADHLYLFPGATRLDDTVHAAAEVGLRFSPTRGGMSLGRSKGGLPPDALVEDEAAILKDCERVVGTFHDPAPGSMCRVGLAPCSPFSVSRDLMRETAALARELDVRLHTHLAENDEDVAFSLERFGCRPGQYAEALGWVGPDVWHAHCVKLDPSEIALFAETDTGVAHCPCSNCRLGSGVAPLRAMLDAGVSVGLGVDGSASSDAANMMDEARQAMLLQRAVGGPGAMSPHTALRLATRGGAEVLGRDDIGVVAPGRRADLAVWDARGIDSAGSWDPAALPLAGPRRVRDLWVEGRLVVVGGRIATLDLPVEIERAEAALRDLTH